MNKHASQPRAIYYVVALQIWEYFSFYGMRALLILYLTNQLKYNDTHAYELFSAYCSLVYVTPILGGFLADKVLGNRMAVMLGALLMAIGHVVLGASEIHPSFLYLSLAIIVCGYGLFKSNVSCLLGELYEPTDPRRDGGFSLMYAAGNVGSIIAPIACGYAQEEYSWAMGFGLAAVGMIAGLVISYVAIVISHIPAALTKSTACDKLSAAELGMAAGSAGGNACADYRTVLERMVGIRLDCRDYHWPGCTGKNLSQSRKPETA